MSRSLCRKGMTWKPCSSTSSRWREQRLHELVDGSRQGGRLVNTLAVIMSASVREHSRRKLIFVFAGLSVAVTVILIAVTRDASAEAVFGPQAGLGNFVALGVLQLFALTATLAVS